MRHIVKAVLFDPRAKKEFDKFDRMVKRKFYELIEELETTGKLERPQAKKLNKDLYEMRVRHQGQWRALYAYIDHDRIIVLSCFRKKTSKLPRSQRQLAVSRLAEYL